jgi:hypothetical protein
MDVVIEVKTEETRVYLSSPKDSIGGTHPCSPLSTLEPRSRGDSVLAIRRNKSPLWCVCVEGRGDLGVCLLLKLRLSISISSDLSKTSKLVRRKQPI